MLGCWYPGSEGTYGSDEGTSGSLHGGIGGSDEGTSGSLHGGIGGSDEGTSGSLHGGIGGSDEGSDVELDKDSDVELDKDSDEDTGIGGYGMDTLVLSEYIGIGSSPNTAANLIPCPPLVMLVDFLVEDLQSSAYTE